MRRKYRPVLAFGLNKAAALSFPLPVVLLPVHNRLPLVLTCKGVYSEIETPAVCAASKITPLASATLNLAVFGYC